MKKNILLRTNLLVCLIILIGFSLTALLSYRANYSTSLVNIEQVSSLTSEGVYYQLSSTFDKPVNISLTMANDSLLKALLSEEEERLGDQSYLDSIQEYLSAYQVKYGYDSVFLVSDATKRYYNFNGLDRVLTQDNPENAWYYHFRESPEDYDVVVDNDEVAGADNEITVFVNCKIRDTEGTFTGTVGVGLRIDYLQQALEGYRDEFGVNVYFIDGQGNIQVSTEYTGYEQVNLFRLESHSAQAKQEILDWREEDVAHGFWAEQEGEKNQKYIVTRYLSELNWHLVVERDTSLLVEQLGRQMVLTVLVIGVILAVILFVITYVIRSFKRQILALTLATERDRRTVFEKATEELFESIYKLDVTHNRPANRATEEYFESLGAPPGTPFDQALRIVAEKQIKEEFRQGYLETFSPEHVLKAYHEGRETLRYEFMISQNGGDYYWMRITARLVQSERDGAIHMLTYRQNIDGEKRQEQRMHSLAQTDEMTGLLTKTAAQREMERLLSGRGTECYALFLFDIDQFKQANDLHGHVFGDSVILAFTRTIRAHFRAEDLMGRIGGDEFAALIPVPDEDWARRKAAELAAALDQVHTADGKSWHMSASIGVAFAPKDGTDQRTLFQSADQALYLAKGRGRHGYAVFGE